MGGVCHGSRHAQGVVPEAPPAVECSQGPPAAPQRGEGRPQGRSSQGMFNPAYAGPRASRLRAPTASVGERWRVIRGAAIGRLGTSSRGGGEGAPPTVNLSEGLKTGVRRAGRSRTTKTASNREREAPPVAEWGEDAGTPIRPQRLHLSGVQPVRVPARWDDQGGQSPLEGHPLAFKEQRVTDAIPQET